MSVLLGCEPPAPANSRGRVAAELVRAPAGHPKPDLVVSQIAVSLLLLLTAGLFVRTLKNLDTVNLGFNSERMLLVTLNARQAGYNDSALVPFYEELRARLSEIHGVRGVSTPTSH